MKVSAISCTDFSLRTANQTKNYKFAEQPVPEQKQENVNFKGKWFSLFEGIGGAVLGGLIAGPLGAILGAGVGAGVGSQMEDTGECSETDFDRCKEP